MINIADVEVLRAYLEERGLISAGDHAVITPLSGGVSSEVLRVDSAQGSFVVKQASPKLRVQEEWLADMTRSSIEQDCLRYWSQVVPDMVPHLLHYDDANYLFAMEAAPPDALMWKSMLLQGVLDLGIATRVARALAEVQNAAASDADVWARFANQKVFDELRLDPYLRFTAGRHPELRKLIDREVERLIDNRLTLVHGDYSPKNILVGDDRLYILDFEVAHIGDPSFDLGFLTNHLMLKAVKNAEWALCYLGMLLAITRTYLSAVAFTDAKRLEEDSVRTLGLLFLARVDGKSPAEYITSEADKTLIRNLSREIVNDRIADFDQVVELAWQVLGRKAIKGDSAR